MHNIHPHVLLDSHLYIFIHIFIFFMIWRSHTLKRSQEFILIMSRNRGKGTCQHPKKDGMHDKEGVATTDMVSKNLLSVISLYIYGGFVDIRDR